MTAGATQDLDRLLEQRQALARVEAAEPGLASRLLALRRWQSERLGHTYADLRADPRVRPATEFFLTDLYGTKDFDARDRQMLRAWQSFKRLLPASALHALGRAFELDVLTRELDHAVAVAHPEPVVNGESYARAYRAAGRRDARERQIALAIGAGQDLDRAVHHRWTATLLRAARAPARAARLIELQEFLERGFRAFRAMPDAEEFLATIRTRETAFMEKLFAGGSP